MLRERSGTLTDCSLSTHLPLRSLPDSSGRLRERSGSSAPFPHVVSHVTTGRSLKCVQAKTSRAMIQPITFMRAPRKQVLSNSTWSLHMIFIIQSMLSGWVKRKWREVILIMGLLHEAFCPDFRYKYSLHALMLLSFSFPSHSTLILTLPN